MTSENECGKIVVEPDIFVQDGFIYVDYKGGAQKLCRVSEGYVFFWHKGAREEIKIPIEVILSESS